MKNGIRPHPHAKLLHKLIDNLETPIQQKVGLHWTSTGIRSVLDDEDGDWKFRIMPLIWRLCNDVVLPFPMTGAPPVGTEYFVPDPFASDQYCIYTWGGYDFDKRFLELRVAYTNADEAIIHAKAMLITTTVEE